MCKVKNCVRCIEGKQFTAHIIPDECGEELNPRTMDENLGTMACLHRRYNLGDKHGFSSGYEVKEHIRKTGALALPLYLYDHGYLAISTRSFVGRAVHAEWDSGMVGFIYVEPERVRQVYQVKRISPKVRNQVINVLVGEVNVYDSWLRGEVFGVVVTYKGGEDEKDSCWGFLGATAAIQEAKSQVESWDKNIEEAAWTFYNENQVVAE